MRRERSARRRWRVASLLTASALSATASAKTSLTGGSLALKSGGSATLSSTGYVGSYLTIPAGGATVNFTVNATRGAGSGSNPHLNLVIADSVTGFAVSNPSATNYNTANITLPAGTYVVRNERDYPGNVGSAYPFTVNNLSVNTVSGSTATFSNTSNDTNATSAANSYIDNYRKGSAAVNLSGPNGVPLLAGTPVTVDLARHSFNFGTAIHGNSSTGVSNYLGGPSTAQQTNFQSKLNQHFNAVVPENIGKWSSNESTRDTVTMAGVDTMLNYAQARNMRARMHNGLWGTQQPTWATTLLSQAAGGDMIAKNDLRSEISERIDYYVGTGVPADRANKYQELDVYNESYHTGSQVAGSYWSVYTTAGIADIYREARDTAPNVRMFVNEYGVLGSNDYANWYVQHTEQLRNAAHTAGYGDVVGGIGSQYYPNSLASYNPTYVMQGMQNLSAHGLPIALSEFGVHDPVSATDAANILEGMMRMIFGNASANGFFMWGFHSENTDTNLYAKAGELFQVNTANWASWTITEAGKKWQDRLGIADWDGNPGNAWDTLLNLTTDANGTINVAGGFYGDYWLSGQQPSSLNAKVLPFDLTLVKGTSSYNTTLAKPPGWFFWKTNGSGTWSTASNWTDAPESGGTPNTAGRTAYFGSSATTYNLTTGAPTTVNITNPVTATISSPVTLGMMVFDNANPYTINGSAISLQGYNNANGHVAAVYVRNGNHTINSAVTPVENTTFTVASAINTLTVTNLQSTTATLVKTGPGTLKVNNVRAAGLNVTGGTVQVQIGGGTSNVAALSVIGATLDLTNNNLVTVTPVGSWDGSAYSEVTGLIASGRLITSMSDATTTGLTSLGVATAADIGITTTAVWSGQTVSPADTLVMYTYGGDANLDGKLNIDDYTQIDQGILAQTTGWHNGDFNYDGKINIDDYVIIDGNIGNQGPPFPTSSEIRGSGSLIVGEVNLTPLIAIPEPASVTLAPVIASLALRRRKR